MTTKERAFEWDRLTVTILAVFNLLVVGLSINVVFADLRDEFGMSGFITSLHGSFFGWGLLVGGLTGASLTRKIGRGRLLAGSTATMVLGGMIFVSGRSPMVTLLGAAFIGLSGAVFVMLVPGIIADQHGEKWAAAFAAVNAYPAIVGMTFGPIIAASIGLGFGWRWTLTGYFLVGAASVWWISRGVVIPSSHHDDPAHPLELLRDAEIRRRWIILVIGVATEFGVGIWAATALTEVGGASKAGGAALTSLFGIGMLGARTNLARWQKIFGPRSIEVAFAGAAMSAMGFALLPVLGMKVAALFCFGLSAGPLYPLLVDRLFAVGGSDTTALSALTGLASGTAVSLCPPLVGILSDASSLRTAMLTPAALALVGLLLVLRAARTPLAFTNTK